jgi:hypothetical protein
VPLSSTAAPEALAGDCASQPERDYNQIGVDVFQVLSPCVPSSFSCTPPQFASDTTIMSKEGKPRAVCIAALCSCFCSRRSGDVVVIFTRTGSFTCLFGPHVISAGHRADSDEAARL